MKSAMLYPRHGRAIMRAENARQRRRVVLEAVSLGAGLFLGVIGGALLWLL